ncbi:hypothetical protein I302_102772 [Kwoniella bestiolae CBS 10118]|uniref:BTB domain-containing protein n=1 Tax=Kwoniella bestiolae CBS 10118 TaxID=1296100 RepID=A0A1B9GG58_9TREE|nr:hypothetical protein I302_01465 [Kwoniella bestiolae CBS 10118]OCF29951.1 hypothetical protein I302_01465 [Kwoniella bestiolae CBS 10118]
MSDLSITKAGADETTTKAVTFTEPLKIDISYNFKDSDITLVSSDTVHFRFHSYMIVGSSRVLRDTLSICGTSPRQVHLSDDNMGGRTTLKFFLDIIYGQILRPPSKSHEYENYERLIQFIVKYDCSYPLEHIKTCLRLWISIDNNSHLDQFFLFACLLDDEELAGMAIRSSGKGVSWPNLKINVKNISPLSDKEESPKVTPSDRDIPYHNRIDITSWKISRFRRIPDDFKFAFLRAENETLKNKDGDTDWEAIADRFLIVISELKGN